LAELTRSIAVRFHVRIRSWNCKAYLPTSQWEHTGCGPLLPLLLIFLQLALTGRVQGVDYHVSTGGDDARQGVSPDQAWRTTARASRQPLRPGDRLLFRGGDMFEGQVAIKTAGTASAATPILIGSYGKGRATIRAGEGTGVSIENSGGIIVRDLIVQGNDRRTNRGSGVAILNRFPGGKRLEYVRIENVEARGFGKDGIAVGAWPEDKSQSGFRDVHIAGCRASDNAYAGIHVYGFHDYYAKSYAHRDVAVVDCVVHDNPGDPEYLDNHSGNGILLHDVDSGCIDGCTAYGNGVLCRATSGGPVGIWAWSSRKLVIQHCVSIRNRTGGKYDGGGFDLDGGVSESVMQYNYSAENDGAGYLVFDFGAAPFRLTGNVLRFNISENDGRKNGFGGIHVDSRGEAIEHLLVYHNTICAHATEARQRPPALFLNKGKNVGIHNNLFIARGVPLAEIGSDQPGLRIQGNHYWAVDGKFLTRHAGREYRSLAEWRKQANVERWDSQDVGSTGDPKLEGFGPGSAVNEAAQRTALKRFKLQAGSPLVGAGIDLRTLFRWDLGPCDYWGNPLLQNQLIAVGAYSAAAP
jgi:hypothetical protein